VIVEARVEARIEVTTEGRSGTTRIREPSLCAWEIFAALITDENEKEVLCSS
jgi:hypothetical protein